MKVAQEYSHLNGKEYLLHHHAELYKEIIKTIESIDASKHKLKLSKEKTKLWTWLYSPKTLNKEFEKKFNNLGWEESRYHYYITTDPETLPKLIATPYKKQKEYLETTWDLNPLSSYKQTDFVKEKIAIEVQFGKYAFVAFDLFVKHLLFYSGWIINLWIEILPTKKMQAQMSSGVAYYEWEVYNVLRHWRSSPPVPLLILGIEE